MNRNFENYKVLDNSFGYLMYLLYKNGAFSELHLPSLNRIKIKGEDIIINKNIPIEFKGRVEEIKKISENSEKTNIEIKKEIIGNNNIKLIVYSKKGKFFDGKKITYREKRDIIKLFFEYHKEINNKKTRIKTDYSSFFNKRKFKKDILFLINKINNKKKTDFDKSVLDYLKFISKQELCFNYKNFKKCNVHGDFTLRNIVKNQDKFSLIDLDMLHKGYLEIQLMILLNELFGFYTEEFFKNLKDCYQNFSLDKKTIKNLFNNYLIYKILDLSVIKSAYFTNKIKYLELQKYIISQINSITKLINNKEEFSRMFNNL